MQKINYSLDRAKLNAIEIAVKDYLAGNIKDITDSEWFTVFQVLNVIRNEVNNNEI